MNRSYSFCTNNRLCISSWGDQIAAFTGKKVSEVVGKKYYKVFPRIFSGDKDALSLALEKNRKFTLKRYYFNCLFAHIKADIRIDPIRTTKGIKGVKITISDISPCSLAMSLHNSQRFIDLGKTASILAHGVRNPLNAIKGVIVYLSEKYAKEPTFAEFAKIMKEEISRLDNFISRFLSTSISVAEFSLSDINSLLRNIELFTSLQVQAHKIRSIFEYGDIPPITINTFQIEQAILNVINNAIEAMHKGGQLTVRTKTEKLSGIDFVAIEISDTGQGIANNRVTKLHMPSKDKGKGFGLFITHEIIQYYGGQMEIKSKKGAGTTVKLYLPAK